MAFWRRLLGGSLGGLLAIGCGGTPQAPAPVAPGPDTEIGGFQSERVWADLSALSSVGPRPPGSEAADAARGYIKEALGQLDLEVTERVTPVELPGVEPFELTHLSVTIPGASPDRFVLLTAYDSDHFEEFQNPGVNLGASGAALLIELARVLATTEPAYTIQLLFIEGEGRLGMGEGATAERRNLGSELLAAEMKQSGELDGVRLLIAFRGVADADLGVARDLLSNRHHREELWRVARELGYADIFDRDAQFESVEAGHRAFLERGLRSVVSVSDTAYGGSEPPGIYAGSEEDVLSHCAPGSLRVVGLVTLRTLERIGERLDRIDRFTERPLASPIEDADDALRAQLPDPPAEGLE